MWTHKSCRLVSHRPFLSLSSNSVLSERNLCGVMIDERNKERDRRNHETVKISRSRLDDNGVLARQCTRSLILFKALRSYRVQSTILRRVTCFAVRQIYSLRPSQPSCTVRLDSRTTLLLIRRRRASDTGGCQQLVGQNTNERKGTYEVTESDESAVDDLGIGILQNLRQSRS